MNKIAHYNGFVGRCQQYGLTKQAADMLYKQAGAADAAAKETLGAILRRNLWSKPGNWLRGKINNEGRKLLNEGVARASNGKADSLWTSALLHTGSFGANMTNRQLKQLAGLGVMTASTPVALYGAHLLANRMSDYYKDRAAHLINDIEARRKGLE